MSFSYAHNATRGNERKSATAPFNKADLPPALRRLRDGAYAREIPVAGEETLCFLGTVLSALKPKKVLEIGTAVGVFACYCAHICRDAYVTTVERDPAFCAEARKNISDLGFSERVKVIEGDACALAPDLKEEYDFIFLDCAKAQYVKLLPHLKRALKKGGALAADDVLLFGYISGEEEVPKKRRALVGHVEEYIRAVTGDAELKTVILNVGDGVALSVKI